MNRRPVRIGWDAFPEVLAFRIGLAFIPKLGARPGRKTRIQFTKAWLPQDKHPWHRECSPLAMGCKQDKEHGDFNHAKEVLVQKDENTREKAVQNTGPNRSQQNESDANRVVRKARPAARVSPRPSSFTGGWRLARSTPIWPPRLR